MAESEVKRKKIVLSIKKVRNTRTFTEGYIVHNSIREVWHWTINSCRHKEKRIEVEGVQAENDRYGSKICGY